MTGYVTFYCLAFYQCRKDAVNLLSMTFFFIAPRFRLSGQKGTMQEDFRMGSQFGMNCQNKRHARAGGHRLSVPLEHTGR